MMTFICNIHDIPEAEENPLSALSYSDNETAHCLETQIDINQQATPIFLLKHNGEIKAYTNSCPHTGAKLNWQAGIFLDNEKQYIQCSIHGALFEKDSGLCVYGPCARQHLSKIEITIQDQQVYHVGDD